MLDHSGLRRTRYEDTLRALGSYLDSHGFTQIVIVEMREGFIVKGRVPGGTTGNDSIQTVSEGILFSNSDLDALLEAAYRRRGSGGGVTPS